MNVFKTILFVFIAWCVASGISWLVSGGRVDLVGNLVIAVASTGGVILGDRYRRRQKAAGVQSKR